MVHWDDLGFVTNYRVNVDFEYPGDGNWRLPIFLVGNERGAGPIAEITADRGSCWLLSTELRIGGLYGCPDPDSICVFRRGERVSMVSVLQPTLQRDLDVADPIRIAAVHELSLFLVAESTTVSAFDADGRLRWRSSPIGLYVHLGRTDNGRIVCRGFGPDFREQVEVTLDAATGEVI